jgi:hypothetical protein
MITLEERSYIRDKIKAAYGRKASTYEDLLELTCAIEEEFVFAAAPSRLDYFKSGKKTLGNNFNNLVTSLNHVHDPN